MGRFLKSVGSLIVTFFIFFGLPVFIYPFFQRVLKMVPPAELTQENIYQLAALKGLEAFILVMIFLMIIERRRGKEARFAFWIGFLLFVQGGLVPELWFYLTLHSPKLYMIAGITASFLSYMLSSWILAKFYKSQSSMVLP